MIKHSWFAATLALSVVATSPALAQGASDGWRVSLTPYLWLPGPSGDLGSASSDVVIDFPDAIGHLSGAFLGKAEIQYDRWGLFGDALYLKVSRTRELDFNRLPTLTSEVEVSTTGATVAGFYRVHDGDRLDVDLLAGGRYTSVKLDVALSGPEQGANRESSKSWVDPIVGARATQRFGEKSSVTGYADFGGFGVNSSSVWQVYGAYNYQWNRHLIGSVGYRHYAVSFDKNGFSYDVGLGGPLVGLTYVF
jgi:hypothetical protein